MLKISHAGCPGLSLVVLVQFTLEMCFTTQNRQKIHKIPILVFKDILMPIEKNEEKECSITCAYLKLHNFSNIMHKTKTSDILYQS